MWTALLAVVLAGIPAQGALVMGTADPGTTLVLDGQPVAVTADGRFMLGFGRDNLVAKLTAITGAVTTETTLSIAPRQYQIEVLPKLAPIPVPDAEFAARRPAELAKIAAARTGSTIATGWTQHFIAPAQGRISGVYGSQRILSGTAQSPHAGLDIAAAIGTPVIAPASGIVRLAEGPFTLEGNLILLDHGYGLISAFLHLSQIEVMPGHYVEQGETIGRIGKTGRATGAHLHWGLSWTNVRIDPQLRLRLP